MSEVEWKRVFDGWPGEVKALRAQLANEQQKALMLFLQFSCGSDRAEADLESIRSSELPRFII